MDLISEARLKMIVDDSVDYVSERIKKLKEGKDRLALETEFLDWMVNDWNDLEIDYYTEET